MRVSTMRAPLEDQEVPHPDRSTHLSPVPDRPQPARFLDREQAAQTLARFLDEAREILDRLEEAWIRKEAARPGEGIRRDVLRFLAGADDWVDFHDLPSMGLLGRSGGRSMARRLAEEGLVELHRDPTYPNTLHLRITPEGREELRRHSVEKAMDHLRGVGAEGFIAVQEASLALRRLAEMIGGRNSWMMEDLPRRTRAL
jgi:hypothetical protein